MYLCVVACVSIGLQINRFRVSYQRQQLDTGLELFRPSEREEPHDYCFSLTRVLILGISVKKRNETQDSGRTEMLFSIKHPHVMTHAILPLTAKHCNSENSTPSYYLRSN